MVLKLSTAAPIKVRKWVWIRPVSRSSSGSNSYTTTAAKAKTTKPSSTFSLFPIYTITPFSPLIPKHGWWRLAPSAPFVLDNFHHLGFTPFSSASSSSSSPPPPSEAEDRGGFVADMGCENKGQDWYGNGLYNRHQNHTISPPLQPRHDQPNSSKFLTLPTILTLGRVAAVPLLIGTFYLDSWWGTTATTSIFIAASFTDWLDGYIARKMRLGSAFGAFLDPVADKLMVAATLVLLCTKPFNAGMFGEVPWLLTVPAIAIIGREITMSAVREWAASQDSKLLEAVAVNSLGKWKTATQMTSLTILLATRDTSLGGPVLVASGVVLLYISAGLAIWSLIVYMSKIWRVLLK